MSFPACPCGFWSRVNCLYLKQVRICHNPDGEPPDVRGTGGEASGPP